MEIKRMLRNIIFCLHPTHYQDITESEQGGFTEGIFSILLACFLSVGIFLIFKGADSFVMKFILSSFLISIAVILMLFIKSKGTAWAYTKYSDSKIPIDPERFFYQLSLPFSALFVIIAIVFSLLQLETTYFTILILIGILYYKYPLAWRASLPDEFNVALTMETLLFKWVMIFIDIIALLVLFIGLVGTNYIIAAL